MYMKEGRMHQFQEEHLEAFLDACISYESQGKKVSECKIQFDYTFLNNALDKETNCASKEVESENRENAAIGGETVIDIRSDQADNNNADNANKVRNDNALPEQSENKMRNKNALPQRSTCPSPPPPPPQEGGLAQKKEFLEAEATFDGTGGRISDELKRKRGRVRTETTILEDMTAQHRNLLKHPGQ